MNHFLSFSSPSRRRPGSCVFIATVGCLVRNLSLAMVVLWLGWVVTAGVVDVTKSSWYHRSVRKVMAAVDEKLDRTGVSSLLGLHPPEPTLEKDEVRLQLDETRARRKLAQEMRQRKKPNGGIKVVWHQTPKI